MELPCKDCVVFVMCKIREATNAFDHSLNTITLRNQCVKFKEWGDINNYRENNDAMKELGMLFGVKHIVYRKVD